MMNDRLQAWNSLAICWSSCSHMLASVEIPKLQTFRCLSLGFFEGGCSLMYVDCAGFVGTGVVSAICSKGLLTGFDLVLFFISSVHFSRCDFSLKTLALTSALQSRHLTLVFFHHHEQN